MSLVQEIVEVDRPSGYHHVESCLEDLFAVFVPHLQQDPHVFMQLLDFWVDSELHRCVVHLLAIGIDWVLVHHVEAAQLDCIRALVEVLLCRRVLAFIFVIFFSIRLKQSARLFLEVSEKLFLSNFIVLQKRMIVARLKLSSKVKHIFFIIL